MGTAAVQPASDRPGTKIRGKLGSVPAWLLVTLSGLLLTSVPVAIYVFQYQAGRVEAATVRNFRALDAASGRIKDVLENLSNVVANHSFNVSPAMVEEVYERMQCAGAGGCSRTVDIGRIDRALDTWRKHADASHGERTEDGLKTELLYEIAEFILDGEYRQHNMQVWEELRSLLEEYRGDYDTTGNNTIAVDVAPAPRAATIELVERLKVARRRFGGTCSPGGASPAQENRACPDFDLLLQESGGSRCEPATRFVERSGGLRVQITDCRPLRTRSPALYQALEKRLERHGRSERDAAERHPVLAALDLFGVRSVVDLDRMLSDATGHLSRFFDSNLIADRHGRLLFKIDDPPEFASGTDVRRATALAFANHVDLAALLSEPVPSADVRSGDEAERPSAAPAPAGQSIVKSHRVGNVDLLVFIHPFIVNGVEAPDTGDSAAEPGAPSDRVFYMVGVTSAEDLRGEAMRLRLSWIVTATLLVLAILTLLPLLWFWTAGDRLTLSRATLAGIVLVPAAGVVLCVVLALGIVTNHVDGNTLDEAVEAIADRMAATFDRELEGRICDLHEAAFFLDGRRDDGGSAGGELKDIFYCGSEPPAAPHEIPPYRNAFLIDEHGRQVRCTVRRILRSPKLDLRFREYFRRPMEGRLWYPAAGQDGVSRAPYFLERIDSIVQGEVTTVLAIRADARGYTDEPRVAASGIRFESLEKMALPPHVDFAVVDRETGRTLFHSDERRVMVTNFVKDVGADARLLSQLHAGTRATLDLVYDGVPIRARVAALREELPWTLVVYRDHEIEDQLAFVTSSLTLFSVFLTLWAAALLGGLSVLLCRLCALSRSSLRDLWLRVIIDSPSSSGQRRIKVSRHVGAGAVTVASVILALTIIERLPAGSSPYAAVGSVAIVVLTLLCSLVDRWDGPAPPAPAVTRAEAAGRSPAPGHAASAGWRVAAAVLSLVNGNPRWILVTIIAGLTIVPTAAWFTYHRVQLSTGLDRYVRDRGNEAACRKRESYRAEARNYSQTRSVKTIWTERDFEVTGMFRHVAFRDVWGSCEAASGDHAHGWTFDVLRGVVAHSTVASDLMAYRAAAGTGPGSASPRRVFEGMSMLQGNAPRFDGRLLVLASGLLLVLAGLVGVIVRSICAAVMGRRLSRPRLSIKGSDGFSMPCREGEPLRVLARYRSRTVRRKCENEAYGRFSVVHRARWTDTGVDWNPPRDDDAASDRKNSELYVVADLEAMLTNEERKRGLLDELETLAADGASVLVWTRIVPVYRLSTAGDAVDRPFDADQFSRWSRLLSGFERRFVRDTKDEIEQSFGEVWKKKNDEALSSEDEKDAVVQSMRSEAVANPDLVDLAVDVASELRIQDPQASRQADEYRREEALRRFQARAEAHFSMLWTQSTLDERLQLHTFARGGLVNRRRHAALSSLARRGLVHDVDGVVRLRSTAFGDFIAHDLDHDDLIAWRKQGHGGVWTMIWPPVAIGAVLALVFFFQSNPEMLSTLLTIALAFLPVAVSLFRGQEAAQPFSTGLDE